MARTIIKSWLIGGFLMLACVAYAHAQYEIVIIEDTQFARNPTIVVTDPRDYPLHGVKVEEMSPDWKRTLRTTETTDTGEFKLKSIPSGSVHYLQLSLNGFDMLRVRVTLDKKRGEILRLKLTLAT